VNDSANLIKKEINLIRLKKTARFKTALIYPNYYKIGMSNLGMHVIYDILNQRDDTLCERVFFEDKSRVCASLENNRQLAGFDILAFSISYELDYINFFHILRRVFKEIKTKKRPAMPLVIVGGAVTAVNFHALSEFCDVIFIGESEEPLAAFMDKLSLSGSFNSKDKKDVFLKEIARIVGVFVPGISNPEKVKPAMVKDVNKYPAASKIITPAAEFANMFLIEISRGCPHHCNFCVSGSISGNFRPRSFEVITSLIDKGLRHTSKIGLVAAAVTDHPKIREISEYLLKNKARISVSSLRVENVSPEVLKALALSGQTTITFAPEAGSDALRFKLNKRITNQQIIDKIILTKKCGLKRIKLYFMVGLPQETTKDIICIAQLIKTASRILPLKINIGIFVPKPLTVFSSAVMEDKRSIMAKLKLLRSNITGCRPRVRFTLPNIKEAQLEALFCRAEENFFDGFLFK